MKEIIKDLKQLSSREKAKKSAYFFKTGPGQYGEGDVFWGVTVPEQRVIAKKYSSISLNEIQELIKSPIHEHRLTALLILVAKFEAQSKETKLPTGNLVSDATIPDQKALYNFYLKNTKHINNWDLVDLSAHKIIGAYLLENKTEIKNLYKLVGSKSLWERRIAIVSTWAFIRNGLFADTIKLSELLLKDQHDLMHKATGWMLREVGKKDLAVLRKFLDANSKKMPRTMLRYSIEKLDKAERMKYMAK